MKKNNTIPWTNENELLYAEIEQLKDVPPQASYFFEFHTIFEVYPPYPLSCHMSFEEY